MFDLDEYIEGVKEKILRIPDFDKSPIESLLKALPYFDANEQRGMIEDINSIVDPAYTSHILDSKNPVLSFPSKGESIGDGIGFGVVMAGDVELYNFELTCENLRESIFATARSGHGKTTLVFYSVGELVRQNINFTFFDWKNDYRTLARIYDDILVLRWDQLSFNPITNKPEGMELKDWWRVVFTIFAHSFGLFTATPSYMLEHLEELYEEKHGDVTFKSLLEYLKSQSESSRKRGEYADVAENRLFYLNSALDKVINVRHGFDISKLFSGRIILEFSPLDAPVASFTIQTLIMHEFYRRLRNQVRVNRKSTLDAFFRENFALLIMDEAHLTSYSGQEQSLVTTEHSPPPLSTFFSQSRELLMSTFALTQFPHLVMESFRNNAGCRVVGNMTEAKLQKELADSVGLDQEDAKAIGKLQKGMWIVNVSGRTKPFLMKVPETSRGELVGDVEVLQRSKPLLTAMQMKQQEIESRMFMTQVERTSDKVHLPEMDKEAWLLLDYIFTHEWQYQQQITQALGFSDRVMAKAKKTLLDKNMISIVKFPVIVHDRIHFALTGNSLEVMRTIGKSPQRIGYWKWITTVPGYEHHYWVNVLRAKHRMLGWAGRLEHDLKDGRRVDLYEEKDGFRKAIEIELSTKDLENKTRVLVDEEVDELVLLYKNESVLQLIKSKLERMEGIPKERIWVGLIRDYVDILDGVIKGAETSGNKGKESSDERDPSEERKHDGNMEDKN